MQPISLEDSARVASTSALAVLRGWQPRQWTTAVFAAMSYVLVVGIPTDLIPNPIFGREIPPTWWSWPSLLVSATLIGLLIGTYVRSSPGLPEAADNANPASISANALSTASNLDDEFNPADPDTRRGLAAGMLTFFAVGCPVCNKVVLLALGSAGALKWFEPVQPLLQMAAVVLLVWALKVRLKNQNSCAVV